MNFSTSHQDLRPLSTGDPEKNELEIDESFGRTKHPHPFQREGISSFSKEKSSPSTPTKKKKWLRAAACTIPLLLLLLAFSFILFRTFPTLSREASAYYVVLDCGSTGTRVYVYECSIDENKDHKYMPIVLRSLPEGNQLRPNKLSGRAYSRMETEPGFDKLVHNESGLRAVLQPLLQWSEQQIPKHAYGHTSLFLYATAGLRRLPSSDSQWVLDKAWTIIKSSSFMCKRDWVKIISGMEEAYYGWTALNYHKGLLGSSPPRKTYGSLDLGGSSLQVTFETKKPLDDVTSISLRIASASHHLSAYSLPGYGLNDAFDKSVAYLLKNLSGKVTDVGNGKLAIKHPCLNTGYREEYICSHCTALNLEGSPMIEGKVLKGQVGTVVELIGAPQWEECNALAKLTVNLSVWSNMSVGVDCKIKPCALTGGMPKPLGQFYAMSGFFVVFRFFNVAPEASIKDVLKRGRRFCGRTWEVAKNSVPPQPYIEQYCFRAPYVASLLRDGLHIKDNQVTIGAGSITWTLGVALLEAGQAYSSRLDLRGYKDLYTNLHPAILVVILLISVILLCYALLYTRKWVSRFIWRLYLSLFRRNSTANSVLNIPSPFWFQRWSSISSGDGKLKPPLSPTIGGSEPHPFGMGYGLGGSNIQLVESSTYPLGVSHSYSSGSLGQMQFGNSFCPPLRGQTTLSSRRSQSREDLSSSLTESHMMKV